LGRRRDGKDLPDFAKAGSEDSESGSVASESLGAALRISTSIIKNKKCTLQWWLSFGSHHHELLAVRVVLCAHKYNVLPANATNVPVVSPVPPAGGAGALR
jgi:hypothetical protein